MDEKTSTGLEMRGPLRHLLQLKEKNEREKKFFSVDLTDFMNTG
jgi:hypothetical protein